MKRKISVWISGLVFLLFGSIPVSAAAAVSQGGNIIHHHYFEHFRIAMYVFFAVAVIINLGVIVMAVSKVKNEG